MVSDQSARGFAAGGRPSLPVLGFVVLGPPLAWSLHFGVVYFVVAAVCAAGGRAVLLPIGAATVGAGALCVVGGVVARRWWRRVPAAEGRGTARLFLAMGMLGAAFFAVLILLEALPPLFLPTCPPEAS
jgi:hypothetical protein